MMMSLKLKSQVRQTFLCKQRPHDASTDQPAQIEHLIPQTSSTDRPQKGKRTPTCPTPTSLKPPPCLRLHLTEIPEAPPTNANLLLSCFICFCGRSAGSRHANRTCPMVSGAAASERCPLSRTGIKMAAADLRASRSR